MRTKKPLVHLFQTNAVALALLLSGASAWAERSTDQYWMHLEGFRPNISSYARADALETTRPGSEISFEDDLGFSDTKTLPSVLLGMRFLDHWRVDFQYYSLKRDSSRVIDREINWGDTVFPVSTQLSSNFDSSIYQLAVGYSFIQSTEAELGVAVGLHITDFKLALASAGTVNVAANAEAKDALAPLPTLGIYGNYAFSPAFGVRARADLLSLKYGDYDGSLTNVELAFDWRFSPNFGVGVGYRYVDYDLEVTSSSWNGAVNYKFNGPFVFLEAAF